MYIKHYLSGAPYSKANYIYVCVYVCVCVCVCFGINNIYIANAISYIINICTTLHIYIIFIEKDTHIDGVLIYPE